MSGPKVPSEQELEDEAIEEDDLIGDYPRRGRPKVPPGQRRRAKLILSFTGEEMTRLIVRAAETKDRKGRPLNVRDWARQILLDAAPPPPPKAED